MEITVSSLCKVQCNYIEGRWRMIIAVNFSNLSNWKEEAWKKIRASKMNYFIYTSHYIEVVLWIGLKVWPRRPIIRVWKCGVLEVKFGGGVSSEHINSLFTQYGVTDKLTIIEPNSLVVTKPPNTIGHQGTSWGHPGVTSGKSQATETPVLIFVFQHKFSFQSASKNEYFQSRSRAICLTAT